MYVPYKPMKVFNFPKTISLDYTEAGNKLDTYDHNYMLFNDQSFHWYRQKHQPDKILNIIFVFYISSPRPIVPIMSLQ